MAPEEAVLAHSRYVFLVGLGCSIIIGFITRKIAYPLGLCVGYLISVLVFKLIMKMSEIILTLQRPVITVVLMYIAKMALYALGFGLAVLFPRYVNLFAVFAGLMIPKITIYIDGLRERRKIKT